MSRLIRLFAALVVMLFGLAFHLRNDGFVTLDYYAGALDLPFSLWLFLALVAGAVLGVAASVPRLLKLKRENSALRRQLRAGASESREPVVVLTRDMD